MCRWQNAVGLICLKRQARLPTVRPAGMLAYFTLPHPTSPATATATFPSHHFTCHRHSRHLSYLPLPSPDLPSQHLPSSVHQQLQHWTNPKPHLICNLLVSLTGRWCMAENLKKEMQSDKLYHWYAIRVILLRTANEIYILMNKWETLLHISFIS